MKNSGIIYGVVTFSVLILLFLAGLKISGYKNTATHKHVNINSVNDIISFDASFVPPVIYNSVPDLSKLKIVDRKKAFVDVLLPSILLAKDKIETDGKLILEIIKEGKINKSDTAFVNHQLKTYKVKTIEELPKHMVMPPVSIVLAQAAIESGWGTSRFFKEGNNVFGMWSYSASHDRMAAKNNNEDRQVYVRKFPDIYAAVLNYCYTIGRLRAYAELRKAMRTEKDPYLLANYFIKYSGSGESYVATIKSVMRKNDFTKYDSYQLLSDWAFEEDDAMSENTIYD